MLKKYQLIFLKKTIWIKKKLLHALGKGVTDDEEDNEIGENISGIFNFWRLKSGVASTKNAELVVDILEQFASGISLYVSAFKHGCDDRVSFLTSDS